MISTRIVEDTRTRVPSILIAQVDFLIYIDPDGSITIGDRMHWMRR